MLCVCVCRRRGLRELPQEQGKESPDDIHRGAAAGVTGQLPAGLEPRRTRSGAHRADHGSQQEGDAGLVPELAGKTEEAPPHRQNEVSE